MLLAAEELLLFLLDEQNATLLPMTVRTEHLVLAGAVLMDLQLANRIDTDLDNLTVSNPTPLGDDVLDLPVNLQGRLLGQSAEHTHEGDLVRETEPIVVAPPQGDLRPVAGEHPQAHPTGPTGPAPC